MIVIEQELPQPTPLPGIAHVTWASEINGLTQLSLWRQSLQPGAATPPHSHDCDEVVLCQSGRGEVHLDGRAFAFGSDSIIVLPMNELHQLFNVGTEPLEILGIFGATPVPTRLLDGALFELPWRS